MKNAYKISKQVRKYGTSSERHDLYREKKNKIESIRKLARANKHDMVIKTINDYIDTYGEDCYIMHEYGKYKIELQEFEEAKNIFNKIIENKEENMYYVYYDLAKTNKFLNNYDEAIENLYQIINSKHKEKHHALLEIAKIYYLLDNTKESDKILKKIIHNNYPNKQYALEEMTEHSLDYYDVEASEKYYNLAKDNIKDTRKKIYLKGRIELIKGNVYEAKELLEQVMRKNDSCYTITVYELMKINYDLEEYNEVINLYKSIDETSGKYYVYMTKIVALTYIDLKAYDEAMKYINYFKEREFYDSYYNLMGRLSFYQQDYEQAIEHFKLVTTFIDRSYCNSLLHETYAYIKLEKYEEAYDILNKLLEEGDAKVIFTKARTIKMYLEKKLNIPYSSPFSYKEKQIESYNKLEAIEHIKLHESIKDDKLVHTLFNSDIDVNELYEYCYYNLNDETFYSNRFCDEYLIPYENVGYDDKNTIDYVKAVALQNTKDIITIYPYDKVVINKNKNKIKTKLSRIDKFKQKYQIK